MTKEEIASQRLVEEIKIAISCEGFDNTKDKFESQLSKIDAHLLVTESETNRNEITDEIIKDLELLEGVKVDDISQLLKERNANVNYKTLGYITIGGTIIKFKNYSPK